MTSTSTNELPVEKAQIEITAQTPQIMATAFLRDHANLSWKAEIGTSRILTNELIPATTKDAKNKKPTMSPLAPIVEMILGNTKNASPTPPLATSETS